MSHNFCCGAGGRVASANGLMADLVTCPPSNGPSNKAVPFGATEHRPDDVAASPSRGRTWRRLTFCVCVLRVGTTHDNNSAQCGGQFFAGSQVRVFGCWIPQERERVVRFGRICFAISEAKARPAAGLCKGPQKTQTLAMLDTICSCSPRCIIGGGAGREGP